jgi:hypothetical protein
MNAADPRFERFEELDAGRVLGDLDAEEVMEWQALAAELGTGAKSALDAFAAELEVVWAAGPAAMPSGLTAKLKGSIPRPVEQVATRTTGGLVPWLGWAVAACLMLLLIVSKREDSSVVVQVEPPVVEVLGDAPDAVRLAFAGAGDSYAAASGEVVWSDALQEGYLTLANLPANDPASSQYQLWIVDPGRDEIPVDGGVFDIPAGQGPVVVPIDAKLAVRNPAAFVITLEQPGGVVRSKQEVVVALAQR